MVTIELVFNYGGGWSRSPEPMYSKGQVHKWSGYDSELLSYIDLVNEYTSELGYVGVQQLLVAGSSGKLFELEGDEGIRALLELITVEQNVINLYAVDDSELGLFVPNILDHSGTFHSEYLAVSDCSSLSEEDDFSDFGSSASDSEDLDLESLFRQKNRCLDEKLSDYKEVDKTLTFTDIFEARKYMKLYALANGYGLVPVKSDRRRLRYICEIGCPFVCLISRDGNFPGVRVKTLNAEHTCEPIFYNPCVDYNTVAHYFKSKLQGNPKYKVKDMKLDLKKEFNINVSSSKCTRAKRLILEQLEGSFRDDYRRLEAYGTELRESNPGSDVIINISKDGLAEGRRFSRMYVCFHALKMGFKEGLRPFIGLDGTFLRGKACGQVLAAVTLDAMNQFYPIAWAIVDKETKVTWSWFLEHLQRSLDLNDGQGFTFISDMQKGLHEAMKAVIPAARHRYCVKHIESNWGKRWKSGAMRMLLWWSAWSNYEEDFKDMLNKLGSLDKDAASELVTYPVQTWVRAYFDTVCKNNAVENNFTESFNAWILEARYKPIIKMLEDIRIKVMNMLRLHENAVKKWDYEYSPYAMKLYKEYLKIAQSCSVDFNGDDGFEVTDGNDKHTVNLAMKKCTCRNWNLSGIPCQHAIKSLQFMKVDPLVEMHWYYSKEAYLLTYKHKIQPVRGDKFWRVHPSQAMDPPALVKMAGRPRIKRTRQKDEAILRQSGWAASRKGRVMTCKTCGQPNHNSRSCDMRSKGKQPAGGRQKKKKKSQLVNEDIEHGIGSSSPPPGDPFEEDIEATAPQPSQQTQSSQANGFRFMPTPTVHKKPLNEHQMPDYNHAEFEDPTLRPRTVAEIEAIAQKRQQPKKTAGTRVISFRGDASGVCEPTDLPFEPVRLTWNGKAAVTSSGLQKMAKLKARKGNGKSQV